VLAFGLCILGASREFETGGEKLGRWHDASHHYEGGLGNGQDAQQSTELVRSAVDPGSANPEFTSECLCV
jgi:hypothetical protein